VSKDPKNFIVVALAAAGILLAPPPQLAFSQTVELVVVDVKAVARGYRASKLKGTNVTNDKNEKIGEIDDIVVGRDKVLFAILEVGGFLGLGARLVAVPFQSLVLDDTGRKIQLPGASREALKKLQEFKYLT
jgi:sporulation protein YlmC with PRC-barrel domain